MDPNINSPRVQSWNATLERQLGQQWQVAASYLGSYADRLWGQNHLNPGVFLGTGPCTLSGVVNASIVGGTILNSDQPFADIPKGAVAGGNFLSAGPTTTQDSTISFSSGLSYVSFLWGSPDLYNALTVKTSAGDFAFTAAGLGFSLTNGDQGFSQYVQFTANAGVAIKGLVFSNSPMVDAFEVANFNVTAVPEPETYVLMLAGLGAVGFMNRRRRKA